MDFVVALFVALVSPSLLITPGPVNVFTVVVRGVFSPTLLQLATASFVLVVSVYFTGEVFRREAAKVESDFRTKKCPDPRAHKLHATQSSFAPVGV